MSKLSPGPIAETLIDEVKLVLGNAWENFSDSDQTAMEAWKLGRIEDLCWQPRLIC